MDQSTETNPSTSTTAVVIPPALATSAPFSFHFRTDKIRDDEGKVIGTGRKHPTITTVLPKPTDAELVVFMQQGGKEAELIREAVLLMIDTAARGQINEWREANGLEKDFTPTAFDLAGLTLTSIANTAPSDRASAAISDEDWTAFLADYQHVMVDIVKYEAARVKLHVSHLKAQLRRVKNDKVSVGKLLELLNIWASRTEVLDDHVECFNELVKKANKYLKAVDKPVADAL